MPPSQHLTQLLSDHIRLRLSSAFVYYGIMLYFQKTMLRNLADMALRQVKKERWIAEEYIRHVVDRGGTTSIGLVRAHSENYLSIRQAARHVLQTQRQIDISLARLLRAAQNEKDHDLVRLLSRKGEPKSVDEQMIQIFAFQQVRHSVKFSRNATSPATYRMR